MAVESTVNTPDGNTWFYRQQGQGPHVVLVPSGEGDCNAFDKVFDILAKSFTVTTFDMPGLSRSVPVPPEAIKDVTAHLLARQVIALMDKLDIRLATFYGCSSGGATVLALEVLYPERVRNAIVNEVPMPAIIPLMPKHLAVGDHLGEGPEGWNDWADNFIGDRKAWLDMGDDYLARILKNIPIWLAAYQPSLLGSIAELTADKKNLQKKPIDWILGGLTPTALFFSNARIAFDAGIPVDILMCKHFPQITIPNELAEHIEVTTRKYL